MRDGQRRRGGVGDGDLSGERPRVSLGWFAAIDGGGVGDGDLSGERPRISLGWFAAIDGSGGGGGGATAERKEEAGLAWFGGCEETKMTASVMPEEGEHPADGSTQSERR
ncbi:hypothetical protein P3S68_006150 [Capsicum galapagoense]